jgi:hypothetical protein
MAVTAFIELRGVALASYGGGGTNEKLKMQNARTRASISLLPLLDPQQRLSDAGAHSAF